MKNDIKKIISKRKNIINLKFNNPKIMGVLNVTPDSFSDGGFFFKQSKAYKHACSMIKNKASIIDIGGESTRPGSKIINPKEEWNRIKKVLVSIRNKFPN